jgi:lipoprotein-anchoring transpeptidase ErfK/SrfK
MQRNSYRFPSRTPRGPRRTTVFKSSRRWLRLPLLFLIVLVALAGLAGYRFAFASNPKSKSVSVTTAAGKAKPATTVTTTTASSSPATTAPAPAPAPVTACSANSLAQNVVISISQQHLWACTGTTVSYDSAVVTGMELYPADLTPPGTYHIYAKETDLTLAGHDSTGSWSDPVSYWMPFLDNQYGEYGFHDATWRAASDFGNINVDNPYTAAEHGSHGCVELPLATAKWVYDWAVVGTTVTIES